MQTFGSVSGWIVSLLAMHLVSGCNENSQLNRTPHVAEYSSDGVLHFLLRDSSPPGGLLHCFLDGNRLTMRRAESTVGLGRSANGAVVQIVRKDKQAEYLDSGQRSNTARTLPDETFQFYELKDGAAYLVKLNPHVGSGGNRFLTDVQFRSQENSRWVDVIKRSAANVISYINSEVIFVTDMIDGGNIIGSTYGRRGEKLGSIAIESDFRAWGNGGEVIVAQRLDRGVTLVQYNRTLRNPRVIWRCDDHGRFWHVLAGFSKGERHEFIMATSDRAYVVRIGKDKVTMFDLSSLQDLASQNELPASFLVGEMAWPGNLDPD